MTRSEYYSAIFFNILSYLGQGILLVCGVLYLYYTVGWFLSGVVTAVTIMSVVISIRDEIRMEQLAYEAHLEAQRDPEEDK